MTADLKQRAERVKELAAKAAPGPWEWPGEFCDNPADSFRVYSKQGCVAWASGDSAETQGTAAFIAAAHDMAQLIRDQQAEIERLRKDAERYRWLANHVLACDYGDNKHHGLIGWHVIANATPIFGPSIDSAIDAAITQETNNG